MFELGKTFRRNLMIRGHKHSTAWGVSCINCGHVEYGNATGTRTNFYKWIRSKGWFKTKNGKWSCGSHGDKGDERVENWQLEMV
jgi:uncharacterized protein involved in copper resistance